MPLGGPPAVPQASVSISNLIRQWENMDEIASVTKTLDAFGMPGRKGVGKVGDWGVSVWGMYARSCCPRRKKQEKWGVP